MTTEILPTGVHRREIRRPREPQIIAHRMKTPGYVDAAGRPVPLPRNALSSRVSFEASVEAVTTDPRAWCWTGGSARVLSNWTVRTRRS